MVQQAYQQIQTEERLIPPTAPDEWTLNQITAVLLRSLPRSIFQQRRQGGTTIDYLLWYEANRILDKYCPGWTWEIRQIVTTGDRLFLTGRLTIPTAEGTVYREATGTELLKEEKTIWIGEPDNRQILKDGYDRPITEPKELAYGDPSSNAERLTFRRAAARFGLGPRLYDRDSIGQCPVGQSSTVLWDILFHLKKLLAPSPDWLQPRPPHATLLFRRKAVENLPKRKIVMLNC